MDLRIRQKIRRERETWRKDDGWSGVWTSQHAGPFREASVIVIVQFRLAPKLNFDFYMY